MKDRPNKAAVDAGDLPSACRTWDDRRRVWVPKVRYASDREAAAAAPKGQQSYRCKAKRSGVHFHLGAANRGRR